MAKFLTIKKIRAANGSAAGRIDIYGEISDLKCWGDEITPKGIIDELDALGPISEIECHIFSYGGDMFAGLAIYNIIKQRAEHKSVFIEGIAASAATIIACAGDTVYMMKSDMLFYHNMITCCYGNEHDMRDTLDEMVKNKEAYISPYMKKSGKSREEIIALLDGTSKNGTWLTADEAIAFGLVNAYTPENKAPLEMAACVSPGVFNYKGFKIDVSRYDMAAEKTAGKINAKTGGKVMAFWNRKEKPAAKVQPKAEIVFTETVCPSCGGAVNLNTETGEVIIGQANGQSGQQEGQAPAEAKVFARCMPSNVRAALFTVQCPHCGADYVWDTDANQDGSEGTETNETVPVGETGGDGNGEAGKAPSPAPAPGAAPSQGAAPAQGGAPAAKIPPKAQIKPKAELASALCPGCGGEFNYDTATAQTGTDSAGTEGYVLTCPSCSTQFVEPLAAAAPQSIPVGTTAQAAYRMGVLAERQRMYALDEMLEAAPENEAMILAAKKSGSSVEAMRINIIKAIAGNKAERSRGQFIQALQRDVDESGVNTLRAPQHHDKKAVFTDSVLEALNNR